VDIKKERREKRQREQVEHELERKPTRQVYIEPPAPERRQRVRVPRPEVPIANLLHSELSVPRKGHTGKSSEAVDSDQPVRGKIDTKSVSEPESSAVSDIANDSADANSRQDDEDNSESRAKRRRGPSNDSDEEDNRRHRDDDEE